MVVSDTAPRSTGRPKRRPFGRRSGKSLHRPAGSAIPPRSRDHGGPAAASAGPFRKVTDRIWSIISPLEMPTLPLHDMTLPLRGAPPTARPLEQVDWPFNSHLHRWIHLSGLAPAGPLTGLIHPSGKLSFVELLVLVNVEAAHVLARGLAGRERTQ